MDTNNNDTKPHASSPNPQPDADDSPSLATPLASDALQPWLIDNKKSLAVALKIGLPKLDQLLTYPSFPRYLINGKVYYDHGACIGWMCANELASPRSHFLDRYKDQALQPANPKSGKGKYGTKDWTINNHPKIVEEKAKWMESQAALVDLKYQIQSGKLIEAAKVYEDQATLYQIFKDRWHRLPTELAAKCVGQPIGMIENILRDGVEETTSQVVSAALAVPVVEPKKEPVPEELEIDPEIEQDHA